MPHSLVAISFLCFQIPQGMATADLFCQIQSESIISNISSDNGFRHTYHKAPGSEREESNVSYVWDVFAIMLSNTTVAKF